MEKNVLTILLVCGRLQFRFKKTFLSRDPFEKSHYIILWHNNFFFGSEIKFIKSLCKKNLKLTKIKFMKIFFWL